MQDKSQLQKQLCSLYKLKLIERLMILLFHHTFDHQNAQCEKTEGALRGIKVCSSVDWDVINQQVKALLDAHVPSQNINCTCTLEASSDAAVSEDQHNKTIPSAKNNMQILTKGYNSMMGVSPLAAEQMFNKTEYRQSKKQMRKKRNRLQNASKVDDIIISKKSLPLEQNSSKDSNQTCEANGKTSFSSDDSFALEVSDNKRMKMDSISCSRLIPSKDTTCPFAGNEMGLRSQQANPIVEKAVSFRASCRVTGSWKTALRARQGKPQEGVCPMSLFHCECNAFHDNRMSLHHKRSSDSADVSSCSVRSNTPDLLNCNVGSRPSTLGGDQNDLCNDTNPCFLKTNDTNSLLTTKSSNMDIDDKFDQKSCSIPALDSSLSSDVVIEKECTESSRPDASNETKCPSRSLNNTGNTKHFSSSNPILSTLVEHVLQHTDWQLNWLRPQVDVYFNLTDLHALLGVSVTRTPLSLRPYIPHISLRSSVCCLMLRAALSGWGSTTTSPSLPSNITNSPAQGPQTPFASTNTPSSASELHETNLDLAAPVILSQKIFNQFDHPYITVLDPMCGAGTILCEAAYSFQVGCVIGCDVSLEQLRLARCNLRTLPAGCTSSLMRSDAAYLPLKSSSVDAVVCDFPFGQKHYEYLANRGITSGKPASNSSDDDPSCLLHNVLNESARVVVPGGRVVLLVAASMAPLLLRYAGNNTVETTTVPRLTQLSQEPLSLGTTLALVCVLQREADAVQGQTL